MAQTRRRLRSSTVILGGMGVVAAALTSCGSEPDRRCVDRDSYDPYGGYRIIDDKYCESGGGSSGGSSGGTSYSNSSWYYGGRSSGRSGSDGTFSHSDAVDRGGLGCSASGSGGG
ncbi:hypothetical protein ABZ354_24765 [Streptomyces sp. NPDC005925]|uniref:hypothetical protein n=1 Tax=Streptomyces sp. NPDC005925 TaxID=3157172 RepID=UPI0033E5B921